MSRVTKSIYSIVIVWHLLALCLVPNSDSALTKFFDPLLHPYARSLGLYSRWNLFAPPDAATYFEYYLESAEGQRVGPYYFPPLERNFYFQTSFFRRSSPMIAIFAVEKNSSIRSQEYLEKTIFPYLCYKHETSKSLDLHFFAVRTPTIADLRAGKKFHDLHNRFAEKQYLFDCSSNRVPQ